MNDHAINLVNDWQPLYGSIYSLKPMELEILKAYIENNLASGFIRPSNSPAGVPILFDKKPDGSLRLCVDYQDINHQTIKKRIIGLARSGSTFYLTRFDQCLLLNEDQRRRWMKDGFQDLLWPFQVPGHAFWIDQRTGHVSGLYQ